MAQIESFTFPSIATPVYSGSFEFRMRIYKNNALQKNVKFNIVITPETMNAPTYTFSAL